MAIFPIRQDRIALWALLIFAFIGMPVLDAFQVWPLRGEYLLRAILIPFLILSLAAVGLNILTGYCGQLSLGSGAFMAIGAYSAYKFGTGIEHSAGDFHHRHSAAAGVLVHPARRPDGGVRRHSVRRAEPAHQRPLSRGRDARRAVLLRLGVHPREVVHQLHRLRLGGRAGTELLRLLRQQADREISALPLSSSRCSRCWRRTSFAAISDGNGWRSATWTSPPS